MRARARSSGLFGSGADVAEVILVGNEGVAATHEGTATKLDHLKVALGRPSHRQARPDAGGARLAAPPRPCWSVNSMMPSTMVFCIHPVSVALR